MRRVLTFCFLLLALSAEAATTNGWFFIETNTTGAGGGRLINSNLSRLTNEVTVLSNRLATASNNLATLSNSVLERVGTWASPFLFYDDFQRSNSYGNLGSAPSTFTQSSATSNHVWTPFLLFGLDLTNYYLTNGMLSYNVSSNGNANDQSYPSIQVGRRVTRMGAWAKWTAGPGTAAVQNLTFLISPTNTTIDGAFHCTINTHFARIGIWDTTETVLFHFDHPFIISTNVPVLCELLINGDVATMNYDGYQFSVRDARIATHGGDWAVYENFSPQSTNNLNKLNVLSVWAGQNSETSITNLESEPRILTSTNIVDWTIGDTAYRTNATAVILVLTNITSRSSFCLALSNLNSIVTVTNASCPSDQTIPTNSWCFLWFRRIANAVTYVVTSNLTAQPW